MLSKVSIFSLNCQSTVAVWGEFDHSWKLKFPVVITESPLSPGVGTPLEDRGWRRTQWIKEPNTRSWWANREQELEELVWLCGSWALRLSRRVSLQATREAASGRRERCRRPRRGQEDGCDSNLVIRQALAQVGAQYWTRGHVGYVGKTADTRRLQVTPPAMLPSVQKHERLVPPCCPQSLAGPPSHYLHLNFTLAVPMLELHKNSTSQPLHLPRFKNCVS